MFGGAMDSRGVPRSLGMRCGTSVSTAAVLSPESAMASDLFDQFVTAGTFKAVLSTYRQICELLRIKPCAFPIFYPKLKSKLRSWKAASLWGKLDKRASHKCYNRGKACMNTRVLVIGAGPCGLRCAIEAQLLGAKVVVIEKRDRFSRNNVLHLWPFVIHDLRNLGGKKFFGKFCAGSIDHISIRQLQIILLKVALLIGVEVHENVSFVKLLEPPEDQTKERVGWKASVTPSDHPVSQYEFDVLVGADGKRNTLLGFNRKEFRGKLAIAITANFINKQTIEEAQVQEISGVAFIFNQKFFQDMREETDIDLENIVYYKDDTHYFVMTAKKQSLLYKGVIKQDYSDTASLLSPDNVDREALMDYARDAARFATNHKMPHQEFAVNHYNQPDVAMFDFTSMYAAENACHLLERRGHRLLEALVGDCLLEPFWPTGSGCARGFLSAFDAAWMIRSWTSGKMSPFQVLAEREAIYRLLAQTTPENLSKDLNRYTLNPSSRYPNLNINSVLPSQVRCLCDTDSEIQDQLPDVVPELQRKKKRRISLIHPDALQAWCQRQVGHVEGIIIDNLSTSWKDGLSLCAIIHRYRPDLIDIKSMKSCDAAKNNQLAFDICEREFGIPPVMTGLEMAECEVPDKLAMVAYVTQIYDTFRGEIPYLVRPNLSSISDEQDIHEENAEMIPASVEGETASKPILPKLRLHHRKRYSVEHEAKKDRQEGTKRFRTPLTLSNHRRRSREKDKGAGDVSLTGFKKVPVDQDSFRLKMKSLQKQFKKDEGQRSRSDDSEIEPHEMELHKSRKPQLIGKIHPEDWNIQLLEEKLKNRGKVTDLKKTHSPKPSRFKKDEWNVKLLEEKLKQQQAPPPVKDVSAPRPKVLQEIFDSKLNAMDSRLKADGGLTDDEAIKFCAFDEKLKKLDQQLKEGTLETGAKGCNRVAAMAQHMATILDWNPIENKGIPLPVAPPPVLPDTDTVYHQPASPSKSRTGSESCCFCQKRVYLMERLSAEGLFFHRSCFRCDYCCANLRLGNYAFDRVQPVDTSHFIAKFYCPAHFQMQKTAAPPKDQRFTEMMKRKHAFLTGKHETIQLPKSPTETPTSSRTDLDTIDTRGYSVEPDVTLDGRVVTPIMDTHTPLQQERKKSETLSLGGSRLGSFENILENRTPERVEFENSIKLSEEEYLTYNELDEEELTQKNFGPAQDIATSDDEVSELSADSDHEDERAAFFNECELSFTADGTRKLAESWNLRRKRTRKDTLKPDTSSSVSEKTSSADCNQQSPKVVFKKGKHSAKVCTSPGLKETSLHSDEESLTPEAHSCAEESDDEDEEDEETETGNEDDTSDDVVTDEEYNYSERIINEMKSPTVEDVVEDLPVKADVVVQVPILIPVEATATSDSEEYSDSETDDDNVVGNSNDECDDDSSTDSEEAVPPVLHTIPVIVIDESPPQANIEQDWVEEITSTMNREIEQTISTQPLKETEEVLQEVAERSKDVIENLIEVTEQLKEVDEKPKEDTKEAKDLIEQAKEIAIKEPAEFVKKEIHREEPERLSDDIENKQSSSIGNDDKICEEQSRDLSNAETQIKEALGRNIESVHSDKALLNKNQEIPPLINESVNVELSNEFVDKKQSKEDNIVNTFDPLINIAQEPQFGHKSLPFVPTPQATRISMDKFMFIAGPVENRDRKPPLFNSPQKSVSSPKELTCKLNESRRKIEELQKQLPPVPVKQPTKEEIALKSRGDLAPKLDNKCDIYYDSLQSKHSLDSLKGKETEIAISSKGILDSIEIRNTADINKNRDIFVNPNNSIDIVDKIQSKYTVVTNQSIDSLDTTRNEVRFDTIKSQDSLDSLKKKDIRKEIGIESKISEKKVDAQLIKSDDETAQKTELLSKIANQTNGTFKVSSVIPKAELKTAQFDKTSSTSTESNSPDSSSSSCPLVFREVDSAEHCLPLITPENDNSFEQRVEELKALGEQNNFNPSFITIRRKQKDVSYSTLVNEIEPPKSPVTPNEKPVTDSQRYSNLLSDKPIFQMSTSPSPQDSFETSSPKTPFYFRPTPSPASSCESSIDSRFKGYLGSFAEKIRPKSLIGDTIYLKSMDINLQKLAFPSLSKESSQFGGSCGTLKEARKRGESESEIPVSKLVSPTTNSKSSDNILFGGIDSDFKVKDKLFRETRSASPVTVSNQRFKPLIKVHSPKICKSLQHKSSATHSNIEKVPFVDDENKSIAEESAHGSLEDVFITPSEFANMTHYVTPSSTFNKITNEDSDSGSVSPEEEQYLRLQRTVDQEKARQEARERARMKSDEELGLSPCNYRKRYMQASSLSLGNYEELSSEDFLDDDNEDMYDDDSIHESTTNDFTPVARKITFDETPTYSNARIITTAPQNCLLISPLSGGESGHATSSEYAGTSTDIGNYMESSLSANELEMKMNSEVVAPKHSNQLPFFSRSRRTVSSSTESSPETPENNLPSAPKSKGRIKFRLDRKSSENPKVIDSQKVGDSEKVKSSGSGKKSFFSLLHFGRNGSSSKEKKSAKSRSSSLPPDPSRNRTKERSFQLLKFGKAKERSSREKQKPAPIVSHQVTGKEAIFYDKTPHEPSPEIASVTKFAIPKAASEPPMIYAPTKSLTVSPPKVIISAGTPITPVVISPIIASVISQTQANLAPKASVDSFTDTDDDASKALSNSSIHESEKENAEREKRILKLTQKAQHQQELKRFRTAQEIQRRLQELEVTRRDLEKTGVQVEKDLRKETAKSGDTQKEFDLMQEWFSLIRKRNKLEREDQELNIKLQDLEHEARHSQLQQKIRERMAIDDSKKTKSDIEQERDMLSEMLQIVEKRDELFMSLNQIQRGEEDEDAKLLMKSFSPDGKKGN